MSQPRRELLSKFGELSEHTKGVQTKFANVEAVVEGKVATINNRLEMMRVHLATAEARLPRRVCRWTARLLSTAS